VKSSLIAAVAALAVTIGVVLWALVAPRQPQHANAVNFSPPASSPTPTSSPSPIAVDLTAGMHQVLNQTFTRPLDKSVWGTCYPWAAGPGGCTNFANPEYEWYLPSQVRVSGGALRLTARRALTQGTTSTGQPKQYACRSGMVTSYPGFRFEYGLVEMVAKVPTGAGLWSGLWLAAANLKWPPEIDLLEQWGPPDNKAGVYFHPISAPFSKAHLNPAMKAQIATGWHTFSILWTRHQVTWYIDNQQMMTVTKNVPHQPMYLIADLANYTKSGGCIGQLAIRSVDVWQRR
jgi:beta-glucanase (GH16 family)